MSHATYAKVRKAILDKHLPSDSLRKQAYALVESWNWQLDAKCNFVVGGSVAKQTHVKGSSDVDVFAVFSNTQDMELLPEYLSRLHINARAVHGSRTYYSAVVAGFDIEIVPVLGITQAKDAQNVTDCSLLHIGWFDRHASAKVRNDVRLAKVLLKAHGVYGAESHIGGMSGHVLDILTVHFGSLWKVAKYFCSLDAHSEDAHIDTAQHYTSTEAIKKSLSTSKKGPLIVIDPVDRNRNAAAGLQKEVFLQIKDIFCSLTQQPKQALFAKQQPNAKGLSGSILVIEGLMPSRKQDVIAAKTKRILQRLAKELNATFVCKEQRFWWNGLHVVCLIELTQNRVPAYVEVRGPKTSLVQHARAFRAKHRAYEKNGFLYAKVKRNYTSALQQSKMFLDTHAPYLKVSLWRGTRNNKLPRV